MARFVVSALRADAARAGANAEVEPLVAELCRLSPDFDSMWRDNEVRTDGDGVKHLRHPILGPIAFEYSSFAVDGRPDLSMVVYNPATAEDGDRVRSLLDQLAHKRGTSANQQVQPATSGSRERREIGVDQVS